MTDTATSSLRWLACENPPGHKKPEWMRSACIDEDGVVYAPAVITGNEQKAFLCAAWDGDVPSILEDGHVYLPVQWLAAYSSNDADLYMLIERKTKEYFGEPAP
jgi:hypothetical protein